MYSQIKLQLLRARLPLSSMISKIIPIPAFSDNYIWALHDADSNDFAVVDPGDAIPVIDYARLNGLKLSQILVTHHHADHTGGIQELCSLYQPHVTGPEPSGISGIDQFAHEGDSFQLFGQHWVVFEVPGHTLDHIAYYSDTSDPGILFCGDTLFAAGCGRLFEGTAEMMSQSLSKFVSLPATTNVFCTHEYTMANLRFALEVEKDNEALQERWLEEQSKRDADKPTLPSTIERELSTNPFLRCNQPSVIAKVSAQCNKQLDDPVDTFAALRSWKDSY